VVRIAGDLDLATRDAASQVCAAGDGDCIVVDMADLMFIDCAGYAALVEAKLDLAGRAGHDRRSSG
jgi:anti-anti-sigma factor